MKSKLFKEGLAVIKPWLVFVSVHLALMSFAFYLLGSDDSRETVLVGLFSSFGYLLGVWREIRGGGDASSRSPHVYLAALSGGVISFIYSILWSQFLDAYDGDLKRFVAAYMIFFATSLIQSFLFYKVIMKLTKKLPTSFRFDLLVRISSILVVVAAAAQEFSLFLSCVTLPLMPLLFAVWAVSGFISYWFF